MRLGLNIKQSNISHVVGTEPELTNQNGFTLPSTTFPGAYWPASNL